jgi:hypothetical protein
MVSTKDDANRWVPQLTKASWTISCGPQLEVSTIVLSGWICVMLELRGLLWRFG